MILPTIKDASDRIRKKIRAGARAQGSSQMFETSVICILFAYPLYAVLKFFRQFQYSGRTALDHFQRKLLPAQTSKLAGELCNKHTFFIYLADDIFI